MRARTLLLAGGSMLALVAACSREAPTSATPETAPPFVGDGPAFNMVSSAARYARVCSGTTNPAGTYAYQVLSVVKSTLNGQQSPTTATVLVSSPFTVAPGACVDVVRLDGAPLTPELDPETVVTVAQVSTPVNTQLNYTQTTELLIDPPVCLGPPPPDPGTCVLDSYGTNATKAMRMNWWHGAVTSWWSGHVPANGPQRTIGYWSNWSSCTGGGQGAVLDQVLASFGGGGVLIGDLFVNTCPEATSILGKSDIATGGKMANDAAYGLGAQLLAAKLNVQNLAATCAAANNAINSGQALLALIDFDGTGGFLPPNASGIAATRRTQALGYASTLDTYNNGLLC